MLSLLRRRHPFCIPVLGCVVILLFIQLSGFPVGTLLSWTHGQSVKPTSSFMKFPFQENLNHRLQVKPDAAFRKAPLTKRISPRLAGFETERKPFSFARHGPALPLYAFESGVKSNFTNRFPSDFTFPEKVDCISLLEGDGQSRERLKDFKGKERKADRFIESTEDCHRFKRDFGYITNSLTDEEKSFPIAYSILLYKDTEQVERLLRAIYRPQNFYCLHVDSKASSEVKKSIETISCCFDNVFVSSRSVDVVWGTFTVLEAELICMQDLWRRSKKWRYFINLTGQEFPLRTNWELVQILKSFNGANNIEGSLKRTRPERFKDAGPPPHTLVAVKGGVHIAASRPFVDFILHDSRAADFVNWSKNTYIPDETFFSSLNYNPALKIKGTYKGSPESDDARNPFLTRYKNWAEDWHCFGEYVHDICVAGVGDLPLLATREELFVNKFVWGFQDAAVYCLDELLYNRTVDEYYGFLQFNTSYYGSRDFVVNQVN